jgi:hypothetical protein
MACSVLDLFPLWPCIIDCVIIGSAIIDKGDIGHIVIDDHIAVSSIHVYIGLGDLILRHKCPILRSRPVAVIVAGAIRCPAIVSVIVTPCHLGRCPDIAWYPHPAIKRVKYPAAIMKRCPAPVIV